MTDLVSASITLPDDGDEFQFMYLDTAKYKSLIDRHQFLQRAVHAQATREELLSHSLLHLNAAELYAAYAETKKLLFQAAVQGLASRVAQQQRELCAQIFIKAPDGQEEDYIRHAPEPDLYGKGQFLLLFQWWQSLPMETVRTIVVRFADYFGPIPDNDNFGYNATRAWECLPVEQRQEIYDFYHSNQTSHE